MSICALARIQYSEFRRLAPKALSHSSPPQDGLTYLLPLISASRLTHLCRSHPCGSIRRGEPGAAPQGLVKKVISERSPASPCLRERVEVSGVETASPAEAST